MADDNGNDSEKIDEVTKDVLAPADGPRENLILTAVKFLQNPKVKQSPLYQKKAFLEKKGLTKEEVDIAMQRAGVTNDVSSAPQPMSSPPPYPEQQLRQQLPLVQQYPAHVPVTQWSRTRDFATTAIIITSVSYAVYRIYQLYIKPWLIGKSEDENSRMRKLEECISEQTKITVEVQQILKNIQESLTAQQGTIANLSQHVINRKNLEKFEQSSEAHLIAEVKSEVSSLKSLLLSRRQFPPTPQTIPVVPTWQLDSSSSTSVSGSVSQTFEMVKSSSVDASEIAPSGSSHDVDPARVNSNDNIRENDDQTAATVEQVTTNTSFSDWSLTGTEQQNAVLKTDETTEQEDTFLETSDTLEQEFPLLKSDKTDSDNSSFKVNSVQDVEHNTEHSVSS